MKNKKDKYCWTVIGIRGNRSCPELLKHIHCRNCPRYESAGHALLNRKPPENYIEELTEMIARPETKENKLQKSVMVFRLGTEWLALPVNFFLEFTRPRPIRHVPHRSNSIFLGLVSVRGDIQICFSARGLLGIEPTAGGKTTPASRIQQRLCVTSKNSRKCVFPVDEVCGLCNYAENTIQSVPVNVAKTMHKYTTGIIAVNNRQTGLINDDLFFGAFEWSLS